MSKKGGQKTTTTTELDPRSQAYINQMRTAGMDAANIAGAAGQQPLSVADQIGQFMNPYTQNVVNATNAQFDQLRAGAVTDVNQQATQAGAFGGSRHGVASGVRQGMLDQSEMGIMANLYQQGHQQATQNAIPYFQQQQMNPLIAQQARMGLLNQGMGPTSGTTTQVAPGKSWLGQAAGLATTGIGLASGLGWAPFAAKAGSAVAGQFM